MDVPPTEFGQTADKSTPQAAATGIRWEALTAAGKVVASLAAVEDGGSDADFSALLYACPDWRHELVENAVADLACVMEPGLATLLTINERGGNPQAAAKALWQEYAASRQAILALLADKVAIS